MPGPESQLETRRAAPSSTESVTPRLLSRRTVLQSLLGVGFSLQCVELITSVTADLRRTRPQGGDYFVGAFGDQQGQVITPHDLPLGGPPLIAYPLDPHTQTVRDGSRLNRVLLVRLAPAALAEQTRAVAAEGIVAYSAVCTHTGCDVTGWQHQSQYFVCPCHTSTFDPKDRARVVSGPAPRPLAALPLRLVDGKVTVAGPFSGRVGAQQPRGDRHEETGERSGHRDRRAAAESGSRPEHPGVPSGHQRAAPASRA